MDTNTQLAPTLPNGSTALAQVSSEQGVTENLLVVFQLASQEYGLFADCVREIIRPRATTRVPNSAPTIEGVINLRGSIIPVFNLRRCLNLEQDDEAGAVHKVVMVVEINDAKAGLLADEVSDVVKITEQDIDQTSMQVEAGSSKQFIEGIVKLPGRLITLLHLETLLES